MSGKHISPGVLVQEIDFSNIVPQVSTTIAGVVGTADRGPVIGDDDCPTLVTSPQQFLDVFGKPDGDLNGAMHYAALRYLEAGNALYVVRAAETNATYANVSVGQVDLTGVDSITVDYTDGTRWEGGVSITVFQADDEPNLPPLPTHPHMMFRVYAKEPGTKGNNLAIAVINYTDWQELGEHILDSKQQKTTTWTSSLDTQSSWVTEKNLFYITDSPRHANEFIVAVYNGNDNAGWVESWTVSRLKTKKNAGGSSMYIEDVINNNSNYIRVRDNDAAGLSFNNDTDMTRQPHSTLKAGRNPSAFNPADTTVVERLFLAGGIDSTASTGAFLTGWEQFRNPDNIDVNMLIQATPRGGVNEQAVANKMIDIAVDRADCIAVLDVPYRYVTPQKAIRWKKRVWNPNTSYAALYWPWVKIYDSFRDTEVWVAPSGWVSYVYALTDYTREPWFAPAGLNRGTIRVQDVMYKPSQGERDMLYVTNINPIAFFPGEGTAVWGQKTLQAKASALDRVNVRRLMIVLEKAVAKAAKYILFEPNDRFTRKLFIQMTDPFLRDVQGRRGIYYYKVICDESNNPGVVIDRNELIMDIFIQPTKAAEFITIKFNILRTGVTAEEQIS